MTNRFIALVAVVVMVLYGLSGRGQSPTPSPSPAVVDQHWKVVADIEPGHLQEELEKLNAAGFSVSDAEIHAAGGKFTIATTLYGSNQDEDSGQ
jgi:hypothetical protein